MPKQTIILWLKKQTDLKDNPISYCFTCFYLVKPATFLASNNVVGTSFSFENSLFKLVMKKINIYIVKIRILS